METAILKIDDVDRFATYTSAQAAQILGCTTATLGNWRCNGIGPAYVKPSERCIQYRGEDLILYYRSRRVETYDSKQAESMEIEL